MLNLADFSALLIIAVGPLSGIGAAHAHQVGILSLIEFCMVGLAIGFGIAMISRKVAYSILMSKKFSAGVRLFLYSLVPLVGLFAVTTAPFLLAGACFGWT